MEDSHLSPSEPISTIDINSDTETITSTSNIVRKKRKNDIISKFCNNRSHTSYFFHFDLNNSSIAYCKICEINLANTHQKAYPYNRKGGNTTNLINHLRDKHNITKENYMGFLNEFNEVLYYYLILKFGWYYHYC